MKLEKLPITPRWNLPSLCCVSTPDGGFLYVGPKSINFIGDARSGSPDIKVFHTFQLVSGLDVDPNWGQKNKKGEESRKYFAVLAHDNSIQIWDFEKGCAVRGHKVHTTNRNKMEGNEQAQDSDSHNVLISYMCNHNVLSLGEQGLVKYCVISNSYVRVKLFVPIINQRLTVLRSSPFDEHIFAVGTNRGLVMLCDLQRKCILYTLRGHDQSITSLSWNRSVSKPTEDVCKPSTKKKAGKATAPKVGASTSRSTKPVCEVKTLPAASGNDDIFDIYNYEYLSDEFGAPSTAEDRETIAEGDFVGLEKPQDSETSAKFDFAEACQSLKEDMHALKQEPTSEYDAVTLADCQQVEHQGPLSSSCGNDDEKDSVCSLQFLQSDSSSDELDVDGIKHTPTLQVLLHHAEVHASQSLNTATQQSGDLVVVQAEAEEQQQQQKDNRIDDDDQLKQRERIDFAGSKLNEAAKPNDEPTEGEILLVSAAMDGSYWVWNTSNGAACDNMRGRKSVKPGKCTSLLVQWQNSSSFLATNKLGELTQYKLRPIAKSSNENSSISYKFKEEKRDINPGGIVAFSICPARALLWCISSNREVTCEDLQTGKIIANYSCPSTGIALVRECPHDMNKIAIGFSDRRVGIIDISKLTSTNIPITNFSVHIDAAITTLAWRSDGKRLAYGTAEGRIGLINVENTKQQPIVFMPFCGKPVYSMDWQPGHIYVACNEMVAAYDGSGLSKEAQVLPGIKGVSTVSVRGLYMIIGTMHGRLNIYRRMQVGMPKEKLLYVLFSDFEVTTRYISQIDWSPIATDHLAVVANTNFVQLMKFDETTGTVTPLDKLEVDINKASIGRVKWSNHSKDLLLTTGFDGAIRVWDLSNSLNSLKFLKQFNCPLTGGLFLPTDEQILLCIGKTIGLEFIHMRVECSDECKPFHNKKRCHNLANMRWAVQAAGLPASLKSAEKRRNRRSSEEVAPVKAPEPCAGTVEANGTDDVIAHKAQHTEADAPIVDMINKLQIDHQDDSEELPESDNKLPIILIKSNTPVYMKNPVTILFKTTKELNKNALEKIKLVLTSSDNKARDNVLCAKLFGERAVAEELLAEELDNHQKSNTDGISNILMPQMNFNIKGEIVKAIECKQLNEWHLSIAPTISYNFWKSCCISFAEQLLEQGYALHAATYMMAVHEDVEVVKTLLAKNYFKEALLLARIHCRNCEVLIDLIVDKWISYLEIVGNLAAAALVCVLSNQINRGYQLLSKLRNPTQDDVDVLKLLKTKAHTK